MNCDPSDPFTTPSLGVQGVSYPLNSAEEARRVIYQLRVAKHFDMFLVNLIEASLEVFINIVMDITEDFGIIEEVQDAEMAEARDPDTEWALTV